MSHRLYRAATEILAPAFHGWCRLYPKHRAYAARLRPPLSSPHTPIWMHACSTGEVNAAAPLVRALTKNLRDVGPLLLSTSTRSGQQTAEQKFPDISKCWCPVDSPSVVQKFYEAINPSALVLMETEIWPNLIEEGHRRDCPLIIVNGRLSRKHFQRYMRWRGLFRDVLRHVDACGVQNAEYGERFAALGVRPERIHCTGNLKFDAVPTEILPEDRANLQKAAGIRADAPVLLFGSTRPGEEQLAWETWSALRTEAPGLQLILAPRHVRRCAEIERTLGAGIRRWTAAGLEGDPTAPVLLVATLGDLSRFYALADVAVVGGSFSKAVQGHNPLESAALGAPTLFGPHMGNFPEPADVLLKASGAYQCRDKAALLLKLHELLASPALRRKMGTRARRAVFEHRGAAKNNVALIQETLTKAGRLRASK
jgi:3-deoxy-D-manno-octulosonic-acid transferase